MVSHDSHRPDYHLTSYTSIVKYKSHLKTEPHMTPEERWRIEGSNTADNEARNVLSLYTISKFHANPRWKPTSERQKINEARLATSYLHEISFRLLALRRHANQERGEDEPETCPEPTPVDISHHQLVSFHCPESFPQTKWDQKWLQLVGAYFGQLKWTPTALHHQKFHAWNSCWTS